MALSSSRISKDLLEVSLSSLVSGKDANGAVIALVWAFVPSVQELNRPRGMVCDYLKTMRSE